MSRRTLARQGGDFDFDDVEVPQEEPDATIGPTLATSVESATRCLLLSLGFDHVLIDFLARTAIGAAVVLLAILSK